MLFTHNNRYLPLTGLLIPCLDDEAIAREASFTSWLDELA